MFKRTGEFLGKEIHGIKLIAFQFNFSLLIQVDVLCHLYSNTTELISTISVRESNEVKGSNCPAKSLSNNKFEGTRTTKRKAVHSSLSSVDVIEEESISSDSTPLLFLSPEEASKVSDELSNCSNTAILFQKESYSCEVDFFHNL